MIDDATASARDAGDLAHDAKKALRADIERAARLPARLLAEGRARPRAVRLRRRPACSRSIRLPRPVETRAVIDDSPFVEPLAELVRARQLARAAREPRRSAGCSAATARASRSCAAIVDEVHGQHRQGGLSQARYQRSRRRGRPGPSAQRRRSRVRPLQAVALRRPAARRPEGDGRRVRAEAARLPAPASVRARSRSTSRTRPSTTWAPPRRAKIDEHRARARARGARPAARGRRRPAAAARRGSRTCSARSTSGASRRCCSPAATARAGCTCPQCGWVGRSTAARAPPTARALDCRDNVIESAVELALVQTPTCSSCATRNTRASCNRTATSGRCSGSRRAGRGERLCEESPLAEPSQAAPRCGGPGGATLPAATAELRLA